MSGLIEAAGMRVSAVFSEHNLTDTSTYIMRTDVCPAEGTQRGTAIAAVLL